jgi:hypothetical protein
VSGSDWAHPAIDAVLAATARVLDMQVAYIGVLTEETFVYQRVHGVGVPVREGQRLRRTDSFCHRLVAGAPASTADAASDPAYRDVPARRLGISSYAGVPIRGGQGRLLGTLCGVDRRRVVVPPGALATVSALAEVTAAHVDSQVDSRDAGSVVIRRGEQGWEVAGQLADDLGEAMVLADLLSSRWPVPPAPPSRGRPLDELGQLRLSVQQLEHALAARVAVEQAIGVLCERYRLAPRDAFERLRRAARSRGRRVHALAQEVVASATAETAELPVELAGGGRPHAAPGSPRVVAGRRPLRRSAPARG